MTAIVLVDVVGEELFSGASILSRRPLALVVVDEDDEHELDDYLDDDDVCPETQRSSVSVRRYEERPIEVAVAW